MSQFAVAGAVEARPDDTPFKALPAPISGMAAFRANANAQVGLYNTDSRMEGARQDLMARHREVEKRLGRKLPWSTFMQQGEESFAQTGGMADNDLGTGADQETLERQLGLRPAAALDEAAYEAQLDKLRAQFPQQMAGIRNRAQLDAERNTRFLKMARDADAGMEAHPIAGFAGALFGSIPDPVNQLTTVLTGGLGASRGLAMRVLMQGGANAAQEALLAPEKVADARYGGPKPSVGQLATDVVTAGVGGAAFELGGAAIGRALRGRAPRETAQARASQVLDDADLVDQAIGLKDDGEGYTAALAAVDRGEDPRLAVRALDAERAAPPPVEGPASRFDVNYGEHPNGATFFVEPQADLRAERGLGMADQVFGWSDDAALRIERSELAPAQRGQGLGVAMYERALGEARATGRALSSDSQVSPDAQRVWAALERRGAVLERNPIATAAEVDGVAGYLKTPDGSPVFTIRAEPAKPAAVAARSPLEAEVLRQVGDDAPALAALGDAVEAQGGALARDPVAAHAAVEQVALSVLGRGEAGPAKAMKAAAERVAAGQDPAVAAQAVVKAAKAATRQAEAAAGARAQAIDPPAPGAAARGVAEPFGDPFGPAADGQAKAKPEQAQLEGDGPPGMFDDLPQVDAYERAHAALKKCAPA